MKVVTIALLIGIKNIIRKDRGLQKDKWEDITDQLPTSNFLFSYENHSPRYSTTCINLIHIEEERLFQFLILSSS